MKHPEILAKLSLEQNYAVYPVGLFAIIDS